MRELLSDPDEAEKIFTEMTRRKGEKEASVRVNIGGKPYTIYQVNRHLITRK
jgi:hypothetical protein